MAFISAQTIICQNVLVERDGVSSLIRLVDLFTVPPEIEPLQDGKLPPVPMTLYASVRLSSDDDEPHTLAFSLERPDGDVRTNELMEPKAVPQSPFSGADRVITAVAQLGVEPIQFGRHKFYILLDGERVSMASFFIVKPAFVPQEEEEN